MISTKAPPRKKKRRQPTAEQKAKAAAKRAALIAKSKGIQAARKSGMLPWAEMTVNEALLFMLREESGEKDWRTFQGWKEAGYSVQKGQPGSCIWGRPRKVSQDATPEAEQSEEQKKFSFFPVCHMWNASQVANEAGDSGHNAPPAERDEEEPIQWDSNGASLELIKPIAQAPELKAEKPKAAPRPHIADKLRTLADKMESTIEQKLAPCQQNPTPRRMSHEASRRCEGEQMQQAQALLYRVANALDAKEPLPEWVGVVGSKKSALETVANETTWTHTPCGYYQLSRVEFSERLLALTGEKNEKDPIAEAEQSIKLRKIPGYFPTPKALGEKVLELADIKEGDFVLEPSAGKGNLAELSPVKPDCIEQDSELRTILEAKGFNVILDDFLCIGCAEQWDKIIMNPPFEKGQDVDHVQKAWEVLADGGRIVAIMSAGVKFNSQSKYAAFREFVEQHGWIEDLPEGSFKESGTGVNTVLCVLDKD